MSKVGCCGFGAARETTLKAAQLLGADKILFQCPASFKPTDENKDRMRRFFTSIQRAGLTCMWEPRGTWQPEEIGELCNELGLVHCVDPFKAEPVTSGFYYYRLHGPGNRRGGYTDEELQLLARRALRTRAVYFMFNNIRMFPDAQRFLKMLP